jgi:hypothetical protein
LEAFNTGGIFKTDADGKIIYGVGGKPKLMTKTQIDNQQGQMANNLLQAIENAGDSLPAGHVVMNDNETASGMFLSDAIIDNLQGYNASQKEFLRQVSAVGRRMAGPDGQTNPGNQAIMFYFSAMKHGGKYYRSLRGGYRNMLIYGMEVSKDKNIYFRTISFDQLDDNINYLLKHKAFGKQLIETFGGNSIGEVRKMINDKFDVYYSNQAKGIENGTDGSGITEGEKNFLNAFLGNTGSGNVDRNPILSALGKKQAEKMTAIRSRRLDRIGSIEFPGGGQPVRIRKIIDNLMPGRKNPDQLEMEFERGPTIVQEEPKPNFSWYKMNGVDPEDPNRLPKIADRLISPGNRDADGDIARDMHQNFGVTFREMIDALDKAHGRDEYKNSRYRYMPNLGLKDNVVDQVLPAINQDKFSGEQFNSAIGKVAGAKAYADDIGLTGFLEGKKSVTKTDIEDFVAENHLKLDSYDLADLGSTQSIDELLNIYGKDYPPSEEIRNGGPEVEAKINRLNNLFNSNNRNLRLVADDVGFQTRVNTIQDLIDFKEMGHTQVTTSNNRTKYNRNDLVTPGERTNYNETLVEFEGGGRFEVPESSTLQYEGEITFADPDLIDDFLTDMSIEGHEGLNYGREYRANLDDTFEVIDFRGNAEEYKIIKEIAERYNVSITPGESIVDLPGGAPTYKNAHWDSDKVIGHIRRTDRTIDGKDTRFLEEMQSDWLQAMRKGKALDAPFAKNWPALLLKKAMIDAINDGKTHIAWADGKVHNDRYSLTTIVDDITMVPDRFSRGSRDIFLNTKEQGEIRLKVNATGKVVDSDFANPRGDVFIGKGLDEVIGKQMADKILEEPSWDKAVYEKLNALDQQIDKYKEFAEEFITGKFKPFRYDNRKYGDFIRNGKLSDLSPVLQNEYKKWKDPDGLNIDANLIVGRGNLTDFIGDKIKELQKQHDQVSDGIVKYEGKDLDLSDPALPNFYDKEVVKVATKLAKKLGVGKPEKVGVSESNGAWMMELPTKQALGEQTLYMPTLGDEAPKGPSSPPEVVQSNSMARRIKYKGIPAQEISNRIAQVSTELLEYGSDSNPQVESTRGSLYQAKRNGIIRELNELNEVEAGMLNQGDRFMPATGQTRTKEFKNWFKDSKVVDENGEPLVVYRGQTEWSKDGTIDYKYERSAPSFTSVPEVANLYSHQQKGSFFNTKLKPKGAVAPVYLKMVNPLRIETLENISNTQGSVFEILDASNFNWDFYGDVKTDKSLWTINDTIDLFVNLSESAEPIFIEIDRGFGMPNIANDAFEVVEYLSNKLEKHQEKLRKLDKDSSEYMSLEDDFTEDINYFLDNVKIDTYAFADTHIARDYAERNGFDGFIHEDVAEGMIPYSKLESVAGKPIEDVKGINTLDEDGYKLEQKDYFFTAYKPFEPEQIKSATGNRGTFDPGNPDIRFMPLLNLPGDKSVQYKKNKNIIDVVFKDATGLQDKFVTMVEADRHDTDGVRMGGPLHAFLKSNDVIVTIDGVDFRPQWANLKWSTIKGMIERVKLTDDGHALIQIMEKETHRSNKDMFSRVLESFQDNRKNMSVLEREVTANILRILRKRFTKSKPNAQENAFLKDMTQYKTKLTRGNVDEANKILANIKKDYGKTDWWNDKEVKSFARDFTKAFTEASFKARAEITSYFLPRDENSARMPFIPDIRKLLKSEMDYHGAKAGDVVGVVQLSKHNLNNKKRVFGVYFGDDPKEFARMTDNEKLARKKLLANKKFRAHPSYDWLMLGPGDADFFMFDKPKNAVQMAPDFAKTHAKLWKQDVAKLKGETIKKYGTTKQDPEDFSVTPDIKQRTERFKGINKFLKESSKKPLYDQSESNIQGAMLRGHKRGVPQLTQFLK